MSRAKQSAATESPPRSRIDDLHWIHPVRQSRSERTRDRLLEAARETVIEKGFEGAGVVEIAERAGCSPATIYRRFRHREGLMRALFELVMEEWEATRAEAVDPGRWAGASILEILEGYLRFALVGGPSPALMRALARMGMQDAELGERLAEQQRLTRAGVVALLIERKGEIGHPRPAEAADFTIAVLAAMLRERQTGAPCDTYLASLSLEEFISEALAGAAAYLRLRVAAGGCS